MSRLFSIGCSFTRYHYPTWADIVGSTYDYFENWGNPSAGNLYILNALNQCHLQNNLNKNDTVYIMWSGLSRIDFYQINRWSTISNQYHNLHKDDLPYSCPIGYEIISYGYMSSAVHMLENLGVKWKMWHWQKFDKDTKPYHLYKPILDKIVHAEFPKQKQKYPYHEQYNVFAEELYSKLAGKDWPPVKSILDESYKNMSLDNFVLTEINEFCSMIDVHIRNTKKVFQGHDLHPSPLTYLKWVVEQFPELNLSQDYITKIKHIDHCLLTQQPYTFYPSTPKKIV